MAVFKANEAEHYRGKGGTGFFSISNDKETKRVRFMYRSANEVEGMSVHKIKFNDRDRYVNCIRNYDDPIDNCPFCKQRYAIQSRIFIPIYNEDEGEVQLWDRGAKTWVGRMTSLCARYSSSDKQLVGSLFDVERNGKPKDMKTDYNLYYIESDDTRMEDLPEPKKALGGLVLDKSYEEMEYYLNHGDFPETADKAEDEPIRRRSDRRTPSDMGGEKF